MVLAILFFVKLGTSYFDYKKHGQFEMTAPAILFERLRGECVKEVKRLNGHFSIDDAFYWQKGND